MNTITLHQWTNMKAAGWKKLKTPVAVPKDVLGGYTGHRQKSYPNFTKLGELSCRRRTPTSLQIDSVNSSHAALKYKLQLILKYSWSQREGSSYCCVHLLLVEQSYATEIRCTQSWSKPFKHILLITQPWSVTEGMSNSFSSVSWSQDGHGRLALKYAESKTMLINVNCVSMLLSELVLLLGEKKVNKHYKRDMAF